VTPSNLNLSSIRHTNLASYHPRLPRRFPALDLAMAFVVVVTAGFH